MPKICEVFSKRCGPFIMPAAQLVAISETSNGGLKYMSLTFEGKRSTAAGQTGLYPIYIGTAGKT